MLTLLGQDKLLQFEASFIPLFVMLDWLKYYDSDRKLHGVYPYTGLSSNNLVRGYINDTKYSEAAKVGLVEFLTNKKTWENRFKTYKEIQNRIDALYEHVCKGEVKNSEETAREAGDLLLELVFNSLTVERLDQKITEETLQELKIKVDFEKIWNISMFQDFLSFEIQNKKYTLDVIKNKKSPACAQYVYTSYIHMPTPEEVENNLKKINVKNLEREIVAAQKSADEAAQQRKKLLLTCTPNEKNVAEYVRWAMHLRDERKGQISKANVVMYRMAEELLASMKLDKKLAALIILDDLVKGRKYIADNIEVIKKRRGNFGVVYFDENHSVQFTENLKENVEMMDAFLEKQNGSRSNTLIGEVGSKGKCRGRVTIVLNPKKINSFPKGSILVAPMTRPEYVPLMKKAAAVVTDEGGITCHAAIVSRELGIPCVIGTKNATKVLKDGDMVEVDAEKGVVKILK